MYFTGGLRIVVSTESKVQLTYALAKRNVRSQGAFGK